MARIYQADVWCDDCGRAIERELQAAGKAPEDPLDEGSYDSDDYPKWGDDDEESDLPQHCGAGAECLSPTIIGGEPYGHFFGNALTSDGVEYVKEACRRGGTVARFWADYYDLTVGCCHKLAEDCQCEE